MRFGKVGGAVAALALVSVFVFGGMEVVHADDATGPGPIMPPAVSYDLGYATGSATATSSVDGAVVHMTLFRLTGDEGSSSQELGCPGGTGGSQPNTLRCDFGQLTPGIWKVRSWQELDGKQSLPNYGYFRVPAAPAITANTADQTVNFSGTGTKHDLVSVLDRGLKQICSVTVDDHGNWTCSASATTGEHSFQAFQLDQGWSPRIDGAESPRSSVLQGKSALTAPVGVTVTVPDPTPTPSPTPSPTPDPTPTPTPSASPQPSAPPAPPAAIPAILHWLLTVTGMNAPLHPGDAVTLGGTGLPAGSVVRLAIHSTPISLGSAVIAKNGSFSKTVTIPQNIAPGSHHFVATLTAPGIAPSAVETAVTIAAPEQLTTLALPVTPDSAATPAPADPAAGSNHKPAHKTAPAGVAPRDNPEAPSALSNALPTLATLMHNPVTIPLAAGFALAILLLVAIPTEILNNTIASNLDRFGSLMARTERAAERAAAWLNRVTRTPAVAAAILILITSIIFGFTDPDYGFNLVSVRLTIALALAMFVIYYLSSRLSGWIVKARWHIDSSISLHPLAVIFAIVGVILARLFGFSPGFLIGFALGLQLSGSSTSANRAKAVVVRTSIVVGLALLSWAGYSLFEFWTEGSPETFWGGITQETLVAVTAEGLTGALVSLLPLGFMEGRELWEHSKAAWTGLFLATGTFFSLLVLPTAMHGEAIGENIIAWLLVLCGFTIVALGTWLFLRLTDKPEAGESKEELENAEDERVQI